ncbi:serpin B4-like [Rhineura floridana]|uniref:serpin B4-like n=1 Tax=Rhineura floridana TaxID=261503 RepID=UPI002AC7EBDA|nr:serpin B4-like [Rhineura floridana]
MDQELLLDYRFQAEPAQDILLVLHFDKLLNTGTSGSGDSSATRPQVQCFNKPADSQCDKPGGIYSQFQALLSQLNKSNNKYALSNANGLFIATEFQLVVHYEDCIKKLYNANLETTDFAKTEEARQTINLQVESQTHE